MNTKERLKNEDEIKTTARNLHQLADDLLSTLNPDFLIGLNPTTTLRDWGPAIKMTDSLGGIVENHPLRDDGLVVTSEVFYIDTKLGLARTYNRWYRLLGKRTDRRSLPVVTMGRSD
ncbi:DUF6634 family protein [Hoeflea sp.]|uniref:DUF6634 family protein n=1 Tax=Hoeflea sp. TaxID=1940281 RepID=UPI003A946CD5